VITVWECELRNSSQLDERLNALVEEIRNAGEVKRIKDMNKRQSRAEARREREALLRRQAELEAEINQLYPIPKRIRTLSRAFDGDE